MKKAEVNLLTVLFILVSAFVGGGIVEKESEGGVTLSVGYSDANESKPICIPQKKEIDIPLRLN